MKTRALLIASFACLVLSGAASAQSVAAVQNPALGGLPPHEILTIVRSTGFEPIGQPVRHGPAYTLRAFDRYDLPVRLVVDARTGRILSAGEAPSRYAAPYRPVYDPYDAPVYGRIFGPPIVGDGFAARPPANVPSVRPRPKATASAAPLPRPRPYVRDATGSIASPPAPQKTPEPPKDNGTSLPPVAPLD